MYPDPLFSIGNVHVYAYGLCMAVGIILCFVFLLWTFSYKNFNEECTDKMLLLGIVATGIGILFAMIFQYIYDVIANPGEDVKFGNMTFLGGLIGGVGSYLIVYNTYVYAIAPRTKIKWLQNNMNASLTDALPFIPIAIVIAHAFGRLGCTFAGCCHGPETDAWYGLYMYARSYGEYTTVIPTQLFECIFLFVLSAVMALLYFKFRFNCNFGVYCIAYGVWRFLIEFVRDDDRGGFIPGLTPSQFWCIIMVVLGIGYFFLYKYVFKKMMKHPELQEPVNEYMKKWSAKNVEVIERTNNIVYFVAIIVVAITTVLAVVGVCISWLIFSVQVGGGIGEIGNVNITLSRLFEVLNGTGGTIGSAFKAMAAFAILTVILNGIIAVLAWLFKLFAWKPIKLTIFIVAVLCAICGIMGILTSFSLCNHISVGVGSLASGNYSLAAGAWLTTISGIIAGLVSIIAVFKSFKFKN